MPLTPEDVRNKRFTPVRLREGYDMGEVDQFLDEVEAELERLTKENDDLRAKLTAAQSSQPPAVSLPAQPVEPPKPAIPEPVVAPPPVVAPTPTPVGASIGGGAPGTVGEASTAATRLLEIATRNADELVAEAKDNADRIIGEARTKAERIQSEARSKIERLESDARTRSEKLDAETAARRSQLFGDLERQRNGLEREVENLRAFEREYRSRLKAYFEQQLQALEGKTDTGGSTNAALTGGPNSETTPRRLQSLLGEDEN
jgi:DivIVA domain-containing protein